MKTIILNNYYPHLTERVILEASDEITVTLSLVAACVTATSATSRIMASVPWTLITGFEADMPYPPLSPEQPLETGEDRDPLHAASSNSRLSRPGAFMLITFSASVKNLQGRGRGDQQGLLNLK